jgi:hypothetical protein
MMSASECRVKALEAIAISAAETSPKATRDWQVMANQWTELAGRIDAEEAASRRLADR